MYIDTNRLDMYVDQLGGLPIKRRKRSRKLSVSLSGPAAEMASEDIPEEPKVTEKLDFLTVQLVLNDLLKAKRPVIAPQWGKEPTPFVREQFLATPIIVPATRLPSELGLKSFRVWVGDPDPKDLNGPEWSFRGSFVYLTEAVFDNCAYNSVFSGCSALKFIVNAASGKNLLDRDGREVFGRADHRHPIDKLTDIGGLRGEARFIETLYRIRYMTNEQCYTYGGAEHRVHDILGYPIFVAVS